MEIIILGYKEFKINIINYLNSHPLFIYNMFHNYVEDYLKINFINFPLIENTIVIIYIIFGKKYLKLYSIFSIYVNKLTNDYKYYLRNLKKN